MRAAMSLQATLRAKGNLWPHALNVLSALTSSHDQRPAARQHFADFVEKLASDYLKQVFKQFCVVRRHHFESIVRRRPNGTRFWVTREELTVQ
jgi:hypothetical protein